MSAADLPPEDFLHGLERVTLEPEVTFEVWFEAWSAAHGVDRSTVASADEEATFLGRVLFSGPASRAANGKLRALGCRVQERRRLQAEYEASVPRVEVRRPLDFDTEADRAYARSRYKRALRAGGLRG
jgi:hypothetical protein